MNTETAAVWYARLPQPRLEARFGDEAGIRRYVGTSPDMAQPALSDNMLCLHLGGAKEVRRRHDGRQDTHSVELGALTLMPADQTNQWETRGPVDFAHLLLSPSLVRQIALQEFDRDAAGVCFVDRVGFRDPHLETLFAELLAGAELGWPGGRLYADSLLTVLTYRLLGRHSTLERLPSFRSSRDGPQRGGLAPWRLQRVVDYMQAHLQADIALSDLTALVDLSRAHFFRAFKQSTGLSPHQYLMVLRLDRGKALLHLPDAQTPEVARAVGLTSPGRFASLFRQRFGLTPGAYLADLQRSL